MIIVVMGVEGSGKTTVGALLAKQLGWEYADGDQFHSPANIEKIRHNVPLNDEDRAPWLEAMHAAIQQWLANEQNAVLGCSVLKNVYREKIGIGGEVRLVYLRGDRDLIARRLEARKGHFAKTGLLASQFAALEEPADAITVDVGPAPEQIVAEIRRQLGLT
jgi:gluconokinase